MTENTPRDPARHLRSAVPSILLLALVLFFNLTARTIFSPLLPGIEEDLHLSHAQAGAFFLLISLGYSASMLVSGLLSSRLGHRGTILLSTFATSIVLMVLAVTPSLAGIRVALLLLGMSIGLYFPSGVAAATGLVRPEHYGRALALHELGPNASFMLAPAIAELLLRVTGWRGVIASVGGGGLAIGVLFAAFGRGGRFRGAPPSFVNIRSVLVQPAFWVITSLSAMAAATALGVYSMLPVYLTVEKGLPRTLANTLIGSSRVSGLIMVFLVGFLVDRLGPRRLMAWIGAVVGVLTLLLGIVPRGWLPLVVIVQPMLVGSFFPAAMSALTRLSPPEVQNVGVSLMVPLVFLFGGGLFPAFLGILGERAGFGAGFVLLGALFLLLLPLVGLVGATPFRSRDR